MAEVERALARVGVRRDGDDVVLVACSGGCDSVVLGHVTADLLGGRRVVLGHVDHAVRPGSHRDLEVVAALARRLSVAHRATRLPPGPDDEAALRAARYAALEAQRVEVGARWVLTAHTRDDQAETVLLGLIRSTRLVDLAGMPEVRGAVTRPLLGVPRAEVRAHAARHRLRYAEDPSNLEPRYLRNRIRKELLPLLERRYRPRMAARLAEMAARLGGRFPTDGEGDPAGRGGARGWAPGGSPPKPAGRGPSAEIHLARRPWRGGAVPHGRRCAVFDVEGLDHPVVRLVRPGDRIQPFGFPGRRKLADVLREGGIIPAERPFTPVVADAGGAILWVPGLLRSDHARVGKTTREVWVCWIGDTDELRGDASRANVEDAGVEPPPSRRRAREPRAMASRDGTEKDR